jgi:phosphoribosylformylglycinamidine synthase
MRASIAVRPEGVLRQNDHLQYRCTWTYLKTENADTVFTNKCRKGQVLKIPISHYEGRYYADDDVIRELEETGRVAFRYATPEGNITRQANPNGALNNIAGILNRQGNVLGMMPHPERSCEDVLGSSDGNIIWESIIAGI